LSGKAEFYGAKICFPLRAQFLVGHIKIDGQKRLADIAHLGITAAWRDMKFAGDKAGNHPCRKTV
jgi:hypothetical protein